MAQIVVENVVKSFGNFTALKNVSLTIHDQEFMVLLGPSGCGKTTLLRSIAGLGMADTGRIQIGNRDVTYLPPRERNISMVFQSYAIFPHMSVYDNIAFGLKMNKTDPKEIDKRVRRSAELLHIEQLLDRFPSNMSGGQRQRVAVARAIAYEAEVLLMDEPLSNLDALLRLEMRAELKRLLNELRVTTVYVTHDQIEAMSMGDRIAVMRDGVIQQCDTPGNIYDTPTNNFVGGFIGNPPMNFMNGQIQRKDGNVIVQIGEHQMTLADSIQSTLKNHDGEEVTLGIRAENMEAFNTPIEDGFKVKVLVVEPLGSQNLLTIKIGDDTIKVSTHPDFPIKANSEMWLRFPNDKIRWMQRENGQAIQPA